jgi:ribosome biogenesis GTPase
MDLPGIREYGIEFVLREELRRHFPELAAARCRYADCLHDGEDGCVAAEACEEDRIDSYRKLLGELA